MAFTVNNCPPVGTTAKIREYVPVAGQMKTGFCSFDFNFCRVHDLNEGFFPLALNTHKVDHADTAKCKK